MNDFGSLSHCIVDGDVAAINRSRRVRGGAFAASTILEVAAVATSLLWPLLATAVLPPQHMPTPVPIFHAVQDQPVPQNVNTHPATGRPTFGRNILTQPPAIPVHVFTGADMSSVSAPPEIGHGPGDPNGLFVTNVASGPAPPVAKPRSSAPLVRGGDVMSALLIHRVQPDYPKIAQVMHLSGTVQLRAIIGTDGSVQNIEVVSGSPILANAAVAAVRQWKYQPTQLNGKPVEVETVVTVQFQMQQQ
jgi:periplasmic protein TonB